MTHTRKSIHLLVLLILIGGIGKMTTFSIVYAADPHRIFSPDSSGYINAARALLETARFAVSPDTPNIPQTARTPGYPFFIAVIYRLFGERYIPLILTQIMLSLGTIILTYFITSKLWGFDIALVSAFFLSLDLPSFFNSQQVLTDTVFTFVLICAVIAGFYVVKESAPSTFHVIVHGILLSLATLIRPVTYYLIFPVILTFAILWRKYYRLSWKTITINIVILVVPWFILVGGWQLRNYLLAGSTEFSSVVGWNLLFCRGAGIIAERDNISFDEARQRLGFENYSELHPETKDWSAVLLNRQWKREGVRIILNHLGLFLKSQIRGLFNMMFGTGEATVLKFLGEEQEKTGALRGFFHTPFDLYIQKWIINKTGLFTLFLFAEGYLVLFYASIMYALWQIFHTNDCSWQIHIFLWMIIVYGVIISISGGPEAYSRFRIPIMPLLSVYAGYGIFLGTTKLLRRRSIRAYC